VLKPPNLRTFQDVVWHHLKYFMGADGKEGKQGASKAEE